MRKILWKKLSLESVPFNDGYTDYLAGPFPSGDVETILFATGRLQWWWKQNLSLITEFEYNDSKRND